MQFFDKMADLKKASDTFAPMMQNLPKLLEDFRGFLDRLEAQQQQIIAQNNQILLILAPGDIPLDLTVAVAENAANDPRNIALQLEQVNNVPG